MWIWNATRLNRIGLISGFLSFWLATPELLGEERLRHADDRIRRALRFLESMYDRIDLESSCLSAIIFLLIPMLSIAALVYYLLGVNPTGRIHTPWASSLRLASVPPWPSRFPRQRRRLYEHFGIVQRFAGVRLLQVPSCS